LIAAIDAADDYAMLPAIAPMMPWFR